MGFASGGSCFQKLYHCSARRGPGRQSRQSDKWRHTFQLAIGKPAKFASLQSTEGGWHQTSSSKAGAVQRCIRGHKSFWDVGADYGVGGKASAVTDEQRIDLCQLINKFRGSFAQRVGKLGCTNAGMIKIEEIFDSHPVQRSACPAALAERVVLLKMTDRF